MKATAPDRRFHQKARVELLTTRAHTGVAWNSAIRHTGSLGPNACPMLTGDVKCHDFFKLPPRETTLASPFSEGALHLLN
jgi:hypothetical protein